MVIETVSILIDWPHSSFCIFVVINIMVIAVKLNLYWTKLTCIEYSFNSWNEIWKALEWHSVFLVLLWPKLKAARDREQHSAPFQRERVVEEMPGGSQESEWFMSAGMLGEDNSMLKSEGPAVSSDLLLRQITKWVRRRRGEPPFKTNHFLCIPTWCVYHDTQAWCFFCRKKGNRSDRKSVV